MGAPLASILQALQSGNGVMSDEQLNHFGGRDAILSALHSFDPNAQLTQTETSGGEGGSGPMGWRMDYDVSKAPTSKGGTLGLDLRTSNFGKLKNPNAVYNDDQYGSVTNSANVFKPADPLWVKLAPLAVGALAPMAGAALAGAGIGGAAGLTAGVTGSGLGASSSLPSWLTSQLGKLPQYARSLASGGDPMQMLINAAMGQGVGMASNALGVDPGYLKAGMTLAQLSNQRRR